MDKQMGRQEMNKGGNILVRYSNSRLANVIYSTVWYSTVQNVLQKKATDRGNYLKEVSSQSETVKK